ncbi:LysR family transcriptional regulator [Mesorhizobium sp. M0012]|uniref:LysR family transcriptional regulator n=1 Tax=Mesorhizobium sp. M0012 TaxID=2956840 RepID=UPI0033353E0B
MDLYGSMSVFVQIVEKGNLTAAASASGMSPTMVGNHLHALEKRLGTSLVNRTTRRQSLTDFGRVYYERCLEILRLVAEVDAHALANHIVPRGRLRVTAPVSFGAEGLMPVLGDYTARYPEVELDITLCDRTVDLIEEGVEAAIRIGSLPDSGLIARPLMPYRMMICASPDYIAKHGEPHRPADLAGHRCVAFRYSAESAWRMIGEEGTSRVRVSGMIQVNNGQAIRVAALNGLGVVMQPEVLLAEDVTAGRLIRLLPNYELPSRPMQIVYLRDHHMSPKLRSFIDFIADRFGG